MKKLKNSTKDSNTYKKICRICDEKNKQTRAYVNCTMHKGTICMEHCEHCRYRYTSRGSTHCTYKEGGNTHEIQ